MSSTPEPTQAWPGRRALGALVVGVLLAHGALFWLLRTDGPPLAAPAATPRPPAQPITLAAAPAPAPDLPPRPPEKFKEKQHKNHTSIATPAINTDIKTSTESVAPSTVLPAPPPQLTPPPHPMPVAASGPPTAPDEPRPAKDNTTPPGELAWPDPTELRYDVSATRKGLRLAAEGVLRWEPSGTSYRASLVIKAPLFGQRSQTSVGTLDPTHGLQPTRHGDKNRSEQATHFDRTRQPPVLRFSGNAPDQPLQPHTQDRLSVLLQLAAMFAGAPQRFASGDTVSVHTAGTREANVWHFQVGATEPVALPIGRTDAVHLVRAPLHPYDNRVELWLAPQLGHLPVRILWIQANGDVVDQQLASLQPLNTAP